MNIALFPGSFDPITKGHEDVVLRALPLFDKIIMAIGENNEKKLRKIVVCSRLEPSPS